ARRRAHGSAGRIAKHLLIAPVAAHGLAIARELDGDDDGVEKRLLLGEHALQFLGRLALLGDVFDDPHRSLLRLLRIDGAAVGPIPERAAVLAAAQLDAAGSLAARERLIDGSALLEGGVPRIEDRGRLSVQLTGAVAVHLLVAPVATHDAAI